MIPDLVRAEGRIEQEDRPRRRGAQHIIALEETKLMDGNQVRFVNEIGAVDRVRPKTQMRNGERARLFGIIDKVALGIIVGLFADNLNRILVGADCAIRTQAPENRTYRFVGFDIKVVVILQMGVADIINNANRKMILRMDLGQFGEDATDHGRRKFFRGKAITAANDFGDVAKGCAAVTHPFGNPRDHILVERLTGTAWFLGAIKHSNRFDGGRDGLQQMGNREGAVEPHFHQANLLALGYQIVNRLLDGLSTGTHNHDNPFGIGGTGIIEEMILAPRAFSQAIHHGLDDCRRRRIVRVDRFTRLKIDIGVLGSAAHHWAVGRKATGAVGLDQIIADQGADIGVGQRLNFVDLVGGAEAIEDMEKGDTGVKGAGMGNQRQIHHLLHRVGKEHRPPSGTRRHDITMVAKDRKALRGQGTRRDVKDGAGQLAGDLIHVGDHQQQALAGRKGGGQRPSL